MVYCTHTMNLSVVIATTLFMGAFVSFSEHAFAETPSPLSTCISKLSQGQNRMNVKIPAVALTKLARATVERSTQLQADAVALLIDYSKSSRDKRAFFIDFKSCDVLSSDFAIHGGAYYDDKKKAQFDGDLNNDGVLDTCKNKKGTRTNMTRPGLYVTNGCHVNTKKRWTTLSGNCTGIKLNGLEKTNNDALASGVVLHELLDIKPDTSIKPLGQGCPAFAKGQLRQLLRYGLMNKTLVLVHAPQCGS